MPHTIGAWLCGVHDADKTVMRSAQDALKLVFPTAEKQRDLSKVYQLPILEYCRDAILRETAQTLSDDRSTTPEDSDAKYARIIASSIRVITDMLTNLPEGEVQKQHQVYEELFAAKSLWDFVSSKDSLVRRAVLRLLWTGLQKTKGKCIIVLSTGLVLVKCSYASFCSSYIADYCVKFYRADYYKHWHDKQCHPIKVNYRTPSWIFSRVLPISTCFIRLIPNDMDHTD